MSKVDGRINCQTLAKENVGAFLVIYKHLDKYPFNIDIAGY
ncbi:hypothetical protein CFBP3846_01294 [Pseudomonas syringae pv. avii]|uniref:Uncharacterized protein n=3 Tax=Pseudomonas syringae group TaxID=136849 RepID=A0A2K4VPZ5_PSESX|nr:hypothetical protein ALP29_201043 [Pseudomonas syringae pv. avii]SOQ07212.1 hypothetical protein NCPPB2254_01185 [Pseudomonas syringae pv. persicae]SOQ07360.1 hypothetical protein CFBP1573P_01410 [Pseudomonas syringae pv. persicae]SOS25729.1 hypothetical protein CFBP3846_01294 [Pseudomonas syringae pv. avii]